MSYCTGRNIGKAIKMLVLDKIPINIVADRFGVHRTTIWRWYKKNGKNKIVIWNYFTRIRNLAALD